MTTTAVAAPEQQAGEKAQQASEKAQQASENAQHTSENAQHRQILKVMTGLLAALFTAMLSTTIVSTALPTIMADLSGTQR